MRSLSGLTFALALAPAPLLAGPGSGPYDYYRCTREGDCRLAHRDELDRIRGGFSVSTPAGQLEISIGISREVSVNNQVVAVSQLVLSDVAGIVANANAQAAAAAQAAQAGAAAAVASAGATAAANALAANAGGSPGAAASAPLQVTVNGVPVSSAGGPVPASLGSALIVQSGPGNIAPPAAAFGAMSAPLVVQNTLNDQVLRTLTIMSVSVNSLQAYGALALSDLISQATAGLAR